MVLFLVGMFILYQYVSSEHFVRTFIFPAMEKNLDSEITADEIRLKPFSRVEIVNFSMKRRDPADQPSIVKFDRLVLNYSLISIVKGSPQIRSVELIKPEIDVTVVPEVREKKKEVAEKPAPPKETPKPPVRRVELPQFFIGKVDVTDARISFKELTGEKELVRETSLEKLNFHLENFEPGKRGAMAMKFVLIAQVPEQLTKIEHAAFNFDSSILINRTLSVLDIESAFSMKEMKGTFQGNPLEGYEFESTLKVEKQEDAIELNPLNITLRRNDRVGADITVSGAYNETEGEGKFVLSVSNINRVFLNLVGSRAGDIDFLDTTINHTDTITIADGGDTFDIEGEMKISDFSILASEISRTPTEKIDLSMAHQGHFDQKKQILEVSRLDVKAVQKGRTFASGNLEQPLTLDMSKTGAHTTSAPDIFYSFIIDAFDLTPYQPLFSLPEDSRLDSAILNASLKVLFRDNGQYIDMKGNVALEELRGKMRGTPLPETTFTFSIDSVVNELARVKLNEMSLVIAQQPGIENTWILQGETNITDGTGSFDMQMIEFDLAAIRGFIPPEVATIQSGAIRGSSNMAFSENFSHLSAKGKIELLGLTTILNEKEIKNFSAVSEFETIVSEPGLIGIKMYKVDFQPGGKPGGTFLMIGDVDTNKGTASLDITLKQVTQDLINVFIAEESGEFEVASMNLDYKSKIELSQNFEAVAAKGGLHLRNLKVNKQEFEDLNLPPLDVAVNHDVFISQDTVDLNLLDATVMPVSGGGSPGATNTRGTARVKGKIDTRQGEGTLKLEIQNMDEKFINVFLSPMLEDRQIQSVAVAGTQDLEMGDQFKAISARGTFSIDNLHVTEGAGGTDIFPPTSFQLTNNININESAILVKDTNLLVTPQGKTPEKVTLEAEIFREKGKKSMVRLLADHITLENYILPVPPRPDTEEKRAGSSRRERPQERGVTTAALDKDVPPLELEDINLNGMVRINEIVYKDVVAKELKVDATLIDNLLDISALSVEVNDAPVTLKASTRVDVPGWEYTATGKLEGLQLGPLANSMAPEKKDKLTGTANLDFNVQGKGTLPESIEQYLSGTVKGTLTDGKFEAIPILSALADVTHISELEQLEFFEGLVHLDIGGGKVNINQLDFEGPIERLRVRGWFGLDESIDLSFKIALAGKLGDKLRDLKYVGDFISDVQGYAELPVPIKMVGTLSKPRPSLVITKTLEDTGKKVIEGLLDKGIQRLLEE